MLLNIIKILRLETAALIIETVEVASIHIGIVHMHASKLNRNSNVNVYLGVNRSINMNSDANAHQYTCIHVYMTGHQRHSL